MRGEFVRKESRFRGWITAGGDPELSGQGRFAAAPGRYHLYVSYACPWAHRTLIYRALKGLEDVISVSVVHPLMPPQSWVFGEYPGATPDHVHGFDRLAQVYELAEPDYDGLVSVPVLYDKHGSTIVSNESSEIIRMLNSAFDAWGRSDLDFYHKPLRAEIDAVNALVYENVNNGVYRAGFATSQDAYEDAYNRLFDTLDELEARLSRQRYLVGRQPSEADWRLFPTLVRFDAVYYSHFKCNRRRLVDYPNLWRYTRDLFQIPRVARTVAATHPSILPASCLKGRISISKHPIAGTGSKTSFAPEILLKLQEKPHVKEYRNQLWNRRQGLSLAAVPNVHFPDRRRQLSRLHAQGTGKAPGGRNA